VLKEANKMEQNLISKKELLDLTGISYGQLYRWKRKNLIPEEWFIKKSSFTGQETFFPKDKILDRIDKIVNMKEDLSLDDIANAVSPNPIDLTLSKSEVSERNIVSETAFNLYCELFPQTELFTFDKLVSLYIADKLLQSGNISLEEGCLLLEVTGNNYAKTSGRGGNIFIVRKSGVGVCFLIPGESEIFFDSSTKVIARENISTCIEELKSKIS
jgi:DNA-binding transcriptional MerR regulator